jgi:hypothetical protein
MDALSDVLSAVRLTGAVFLDMDLRAEWSYITAPARKIADVLMPAADHVIPYHLVTEGTCYARLLDGDPVELNAGDLILFPHGDRHMLLTASESGLRLKPTDITGESLSKLLKRGDVAAFKKGRTGKATRIVCGFLACDKRLAEPILLSLPRLLKVSMRDGGTGERSAALDTMWTDWDSFRGRLEAYALLNAWVSSAITWWSMHFASRRGLNRFFRKESGAVIIFFGDGTPP